MDIAHVVALTHELINEICSFVIIAVTALMSWRWIWHKEKILMGHRIRNFVMAALLIGVYGFSFWYQAFPGRDDNAFARWTGTNIPDSVATLANVTGQKVKAVFSIVLWLAMTIIAIRWCNIAFSITALLLLGFSILFSFNTLFG